MRFMNDYDLDYAINRFTRSSTPNRLGAALVVAHLSDWTDQNSDGWAYWSLPLRAAAKAIAVIESTTNYANNWQEENDISDAELVAVIRPIKAFLTRQHVSAETRDIILRGATA